MFFKTAVLGIVKDRFPIKVGGCVSGLKWEYKMTQNVINVTIKVTSGFFWTFRKKLKAKKTQAKKKLKQIFKKLKQIIQKLNNLPTKN